MRSPVTPPTPPSTSLNLEHSDHIRVIVPALNASRDWPAFSAALLSNIAPDHVLIIDSSSTDGTGELARASGFQFKIIARSDFDHGATRQLGADWFSDAGILVFLTQDAELASPDAIASLCAAFHDPEIGAAYGRQLPRRDAREIETHARLFNYPATSHVSSVEANSALGFKSLFFSDSFGAYRASALRAVGGFPRHVIFGEDTVTVANLLLGGWKIAYVANAQVYHSHAYRISQEFSRYFDIGVLHCRAAELFRPFGTASGEGMKFVQSELAFLRRRNPKLIPSALIRTWMKFIGYRLGRLERLIPGAVKAALSASSAFWNKR